jgi:hypothetical protein
MPDNKTGTGVKEGTDFNTGLPTGLPAAGGPATPGGGPTDKDLSGGGGGGVSYPNQLGGKGQSSYWKTPGDVGAAGIGAGGNKPRSKPQMWVISSDEIQVTVTGQFPVDDLQLNTIGGNYAEITSVNQQNPISQWIRGQLETVTLTSEFFAQHSQEDVVDKFDHLLMLTRRDDYFFRPPTCVFTFGTKLSRQCQLEHVSNIAYGPLRPDGTPQRIRFTMTLRNYDPSVVQPTDPTNVVKQSRMRAAKTGDTYESIAADEYRGNAMAGEYLRRWLRYHPDLVEGDKVHILTQDYIAQQGPVYPQSPLLFAMTAYQKFSAALFDARSGSLTVTSRG